MVQSHLGKAGGNLQQSAKCSNQRDLSWASFLVPVSIPNFRSKSSFFSLCDAADRTRACGLVSCVPVAGSWHVLVVDGCLVLAGVTSPPSLTAREHSCWYDGVCEFVSKERRLRRESRAAAIC